MFKVDDKVRVVNDRDNWLNDDQPDDTVLTVVNDRDSKNEIEIYAVNRWPEDFELVFSPSMKEETKSFKVEPQFLVDGTKILINKAHLENEVAVRDNQLLGAWRLNVNGGFISGINLGVGVLGETPSETVVPKKRHDDLVDASCFTIAGDGLGVYRPNLEDRKVGKVGMHMVIDGFPRALREVAKVMTWAADAKGYKLHDWRNLPNADVDFPAAEYRHQNDNCIMKAEGTPAIERTDHESNLLHAAHKVFNSLAELELILAGVIK